MAAAQQVKTIAYWQALQRQQKRGREKDRIRHREDLARIRQRAKEQREAATQRLKLQHQDKIDKITKIRIEREAAYQQRIQELERELDRCKGRPEKQPKAKNPRKPKTATDKPKGKPKGSTSGRKPHEELPPQIVTITLDEMQRRCPCCSEIAQEMPLCASSEQVDWEVKLVRKRTLRQTYKHSCTCPDRPAMFAAPPPPPQAMTQSKYSDRFWIQVLMRKFYLQIPLTVTAKELAASGLKGVNEGTLLAGLGRMVAFLMPLVNAIKTCCQESPLTGSDESRLSCFGASVDEVHNGYLWQHQCTLAVYFDFVMRRSGDYLADFYRKARCFLVVDRHKLYKCKAMAGCQNVTLAFCWNHTRNDFKELLDTPGQQRWAGGYIRRIRELYTRNDQRRKARGSPRFAYHDSSLKALIAAFKAHAQSELEENAALLPPDGAEPKNHTQRIALARHQVLDCLLRHWEGLTVFVDHPQVPMDNNQTEREFIDLARYRRNCNGVFSEAAGKRVAAMLSLFATLKRHQIPVRAYLTTYFAAIARHGGALPEDELRGFYPWALSEQAKRSIAIACQASHGDA